jgi:protein SCO1
MMPVIDRRKLIGGLTAFPALGGLLARADEPQSRPRRFAPPETGPEVMRKRFFPNVELVTHEGKKVRFYDDLLKGRIVVLNLMYATCTDVCPTVTAHLVAAQKMLRERVKQEVFFYSITIKPEEDTPEKLKEYAEMHHVGENWLFLTGKPLDIELLRYRLGYQDPNPEKDRKDKAAHSGMVRYGNEPLSQWGSVQGGAKPEWIAQEICFVIPGAPQHLEHQETEG